LVALVTRPDNDSDAPAVAAAAKDKQHSDFTDSLADMYREQCIQVLI
jgi:hypothetical protein